jgi:hypothetical protein
MPLRYRSGRSPDWLRFKNPAAPAVKREAEEEWGRWTSASTLLIVQSFLSLLAEVPYRSANRAFPEENFIRRPNWATFWPALCRSFVIRSTTGDRGHAHYHQSLYRRVGRDALGELYWLPD